MHIGIILEHLRKEVIMENNTGKVLRAIRKYYGLSQIEFAEIIEINQSTLSRIEKGVLELNAIQWVNLVDRYHLDARSLTSGKIELLELHKINLDKTMQVGGFKKLPTKYSILSGSTTRSVYPFIKYLSDKLGENKKDEFLKQKGLDPDYFVIQNLPINIIIIQDIFLELVKRGLVSIKNYQNILNHVPTQDVHSYFLQSISKKSQTEVAFRKLTKHVATHFEVNSNYEYIGDKKCFVRAENEKFLKELNLDDTFKKFRALYNLSHFNKLAPLLGSESNFKMNEHSNGWDIAIA